MRDCFDKFGIERLELISCCDDSSAYYSYIRQDKSFIQKQYYERTNQELILDHPSKFNEKLQWLKFFWRDDRAYRFTDKFNIPQIMMEYGLPELIPERICVFDSAEAISFDYLPESFVLKATHASGYNIFILRKSEADISRIKRAFAKVITVRYYALKFEWCYERIKPRIICEPLMSFSFQRPLDYKFHCFNGVVMFVEILNAVVDDKDLKEPVEMLVDKDYNRLGFSFGYKNNQNYNKSPDFEKMVRYAEILSAGFPYIRVDLMNPEEGVVKFGEFTFFPGAGYEEILPIEYQYKIGSWLKLPDK